MPVQFGNNWVQKIPLTAKLDSAYGLIQFWLSSEFFSSNYFQIGQHVVLLHILINNYSTSARWKSEGRSQRGGLALPDFPGLFKKSTFKMADSQSKNSNKSILFRRNIDQSSLGEST